MYVCMHTIIALAIYSTNVHTCTNNKIYTMRAGTQSEMECLLEDCITSDAPARKKAKADVENDSVTPKRLPNKKVTAHGSTC